MFYAALSNIPVVSRGDTQSSASHFMPIRGIEAGYDKALIICIPHCLRRRITGENIGDSF